MKMKILLVLVAALILVSNIAYAGTYFEQPPRTDVGVGLVSSINAAQASDNFALSSNSNITGIEWWGFNYSGTPIFSFTFYKDVNGAPDLSNPTQLSGSLSAIFAFSVSDNLGGTLDVYNYSTTLSTPFAADANTTYWLSIYNTSSSALWGWQEAAVSGDGAYQTGSGRTTNNLAFEISGSTTSVPEPSLPVLLGIGILSVIGLAAWKH